MTLDHWMLVWAIVLVGGIGLFALLAVVVTVGGLIDVGRLLRFLREQHARSDREKAPGQDHHRRV
jgi:hypothetical protein